ncbi:hypothetical protein [Fulvivirga ligni]|uniref:hypothetical protein n=1 Tax=Fulvivirga ligni TaxID=2904246 RepID=UPI001F414EE6|nr:hypothetical protein [Fulvivirga ligni]UII19560.1 hypothetical protein LVD16_17105 [Fulvivirga ligni]
MTRILVIITIIALSSCAVLDGHKDNQHAYYEKGLSSDQISKIDQQGYIIWDWYSKSEEGFSKGQLYVTRPEGSKSFNFVEIGNWTEESKYYQNGKPLGIDKRSILYDKYGNILTRTVTEKPNIASEFKLLESWSSSFEVIEMDTFLVQRIKTFHRNGNIDGEFCFLVKDYKELLSDRLKTKYKYDSAKFYNEQGDLIEEEYHGFNEMVKLK